MASQAVIGGGGIPIQYLNVRVIALNHFSYEAPLIKFPFLTCHVEPKKL